MQDVCPDACLPPALRATRHRGPRSKAFWQFAPGRAGAHNPKHPLDHQTMIGGRSASGRLLCRQKRTKPLPLGVRESRSTRQADCLGKQGRSQRRLTSAALHREPSGFGLMLPTEARPPQSPSALLLWLPQDMEQPAQFRNTQSERCSVCSAFFSVKLLEPAPPPGWRELGAPGSQNDTRPENRAPQSDPVRLRLWFPQNLLRSSSGCQPRAPVQEASWSLPVSLCSGK